MLNVTTSVLIGWGFQLWFNRNRWRDRLLGKALHPDNHISEPEQGGGVLVLPNQDEKLKQGKLSNWLLSSSSSFSFLFFSLLLLLLECGGISEQGEEWEGIREKAAQVFWVAKDR